MIRATERTAIVAALLFTALLIAGCSSSSGTGNPKVKVANDQSKGDGTQPLKGPPPQEFIGNFLKAIGEGKATAGMLTADFKRKIARPRPGIDADKDLGYNPVAVDLFLKRAGSGTYDRLELYQAATGPFFVGSVSTAAGTKEGCLIRLVPADAAAGWKIDWFHRTTARVVPPTANDPGPQLIGAQLAVHQFLENLLGGELALAEAVVAKSWKVREYESKNPSDADLGYNQALVLQRLRGWKGNFSEFTITKRDVVAGMPATFEGGLLDVAKKEMKTYTLKVGQGEGGAWFIDEFDVK